MTNSKKLLSDEQARNYIETGCIYKRNDFDVAEYEKNRANLLVKTVEFMLAMAESGKPMPNAIKTALHYARSDSPYMLSNPLARRKILDMVNQMKNLEAEQ